MVKKGKIVGGIFASFILGGLMWLWTTPFFENLEYQRKFNILYREKLIQYADTNKDEVITDKEKEEFNLKILAGKNVIWDGRGMALGSIDYQNKQGSPSYKTLTQWVEDYKE